MDEQPPSRLKQIGILVLLLVIFWFFYSDRFAFSIPQTRPACVEFVNNIQAKLSTDTSQGILNRIINFISILKQNKDSESNNTAETDPIIALVKLLRSKPEPNASLETRIAFEKQVHVALDHARAWCETLPTQNTP